MTIPEPGLSPEPPRDTSVGSPARSAIRIGVLTAILMFTIGAYSAYMGTINHIYVGAVIAWSVAAAGLAGAWLSRRGRVTLGMGLLIAVVLATLLAAPFVVAGQGMLFGLTGVILVSGIATSTLPSRAAGRAVLLSIGIGVVTLLLDMFGPPDRTAGDNPAVNATILIVLMAIYGFLIVRRFPHFSLRNKLLVAFVGVALLATGAVTLFTQLTTRQTLTENVGARLKASAESEGLAIGDLLTRQIDQLRSLALNGVLQDEMKASNASYTGDSAAIQAELNRLDQQWRAADAADDNADPLVQARLNNLASLVLRTYRQNFSDNVEVFITDRNGALLGSTNRTSDYNQADEAWWQAAYKNGQGGVYISTPEFDQSAGALSILIAVPVREFRTGEPIGVLRTTYLAKSLYAALTARQLGKTGQSDLYLPDGKVYTPQTGTLTDADPEVVAQLNASAGRDFAELTLDGAPTLVGQAVIATTEDASSIIGLGWRVIVHQDRFESLAPVEAQTRGALLLALVIVGLVSAAAIGLTQILSGPIVRLTAVAEKAAQGDLSARARVEARDEIGTLAMTFNHVTAQVSDLIGSLEQRVAARTEQLRASADVGRAAASILDPAELLREVVNLITDRFGFYYAAVFLLDTSGKNAVLSEATGTAGRVLKEHGHKLAVGGASMVGYATALRKARIALDVGKEAVRFANPLLPDTRSEIALPLVVGDRTLGALDVQSTKEAAFDEANAAVLQAMADQIAIALNNADQFREAQQEALRATALFEASRLAGFVSEDLQSAVNKMLAIVALGSEFESWMAATFDADSNTYTILTGYDTVTDGPPAAIGQSASMDQQPEMPIARAMRLRHPVVIEDPETDPQLAALPPAVRSALANVVCVPAMLGDRVLGAVSLGRTTNKVPITPQDVQLAQAIANHMAVTAENRRLLQRAEASAAELTSLMQRYTREGWAQYTQRRAGAIERAYSRADAVPLDPDVIRQIDEAVRVGSLTPVSFEGQAAIGIPIELRGQVIGTIGLQAEAGRAWTEDERVTLKAVADQVAQSVEVARLLDDTEASLQETNVLYQSSRTLAAATTRAEVMQAIVDTIHARLNVEQVRLVLFDEERGYGVIAAEAEPTPNVESIRIPMAGNPMYEILSATRQPLVIGDAETDPRASSLASLIRQSNARAILTIPMLAGQRLVGWLDTGSREPRPFLDQEISFCETLVRQAAVAVENRQLFEETQARAHREQVLREITSRVRGSTDPDAIVRTLARELGSALGRRTFVRLGSADELKNAAPPAPAPTGEGNGRVGASSR